jgi:uncharacterized protein (DUF362 family)
MAEGRISRRNFIRIAALSTAGLAALVLDRQLRPYGLPRMARWLVDGQVQNLTGEPAIVGLGEIHSQNEAEILDALTEIWHQSEMPDVSGMNILIKPNLIDHIDPYPTTTSPEVVGAVIDLLRKQGAAEVVVGDGPGFRRDAGSVVESIGLRSVLERHNVHFVDLNYDDPKPVATKDGWFVRTNELWLPKHVREADLIVSVPKLKTHHWAGVSLSLKNLFGVVPGSRYGWPKNILHLNGIPLSILGLYQMVKPMISIVDGIIGMEGDGPLFGSPVEHGLLAVGKDPIAVDILCTQLMGLSTGDVDHLTLANWAGVGEGEQIETRGVPPKNLMRSYEPPPIA